MTNIDVNEVTGRLSAQIGEAAVRNAVLEATNAALVAELDAARAEIGRLLDQPTSAKKAAAKKAVTKPS